MKHMENCPNRLSEELHRDVRLSEIHPAILAHYMEAFMRPEIPIAFDPALEPGVRANVTLYQPEDCELTHHVFSHSECLAVAALVALGLYRRIAAALVHQGYAYAEAATDDFRPEPGWGLADRITLKDGSQWNVVVNITAVEEPCCHLRFVEDYAVLGFFDGEPHDLEDPVTLTLLRERLPSVARQLDGGAE